MCNEATLNNVLSEIAKYRMMKKEVEDILNELEQEVKDYMTDADVVEVVGDEHRASYKLVHSKKFDSKAFKLDMPEMYGKYSKTTTSYRFNFS